MRRLANSFDVLRLLAAVLVIFGHAYPLTGHDSLWIAGNAVQSIAVKCFFVISGYLIMASWQRDPSPIRFAVRRALRIFPGLAMVVAICALVIGPLTTQISLSQYFENGRFWAYFLNLAFFIQYDLPGVFEGNVYPLAVNGSLWSLPPELAMYVVGPLIWTLGSTLAGSGRRAVLLGALALATAGVIFVRLHPLVPPRVWYGTSISSFLDVAPYFLLGSLYSLFSLERFLNVPTAFGTMAFLLLIRVNGTASEVGLYLVLPYTVLAFGLCATRFGTWLSRHGDISYGVYLYGFPVQQVVSMLLPADDRLPLLNFALSVPAVLLFAKVSWRLVEQPCLRLKPRRKVSVD